MRRTSDDVMRCSMEQLVHTYWSLGPLPSCQATLTKIRCASSLSGAARAGSIRDLPLLGTQPHFSPPLPPPIPSIPVVTTRAHDTYTREQEADHCQTRTSHDRVWFRILFKRTQNLMKNPKNFLSYRILSKNIQNKALDCSAQIEQKESLFPAVSNRILSW